MGLSFPPMGQLLQILANLQKKLDEQRVAHGREESALERDALNCIQNRHLAQLEVLRRSHSSHDYKTNDQSSSCPNNSTHAEISWRRDWCYSLNNREHSESSEPHKASKISRIKDKSRRI